MPPETVAGSRVSIAWEEARQELASARQALASAPEGVVRQAPFDRMLQAERRSTELLHRWLAGALQLAPVENPRLVLSLDVDGVLEDEAEGFSVTTVAGAAALKLLALGRVAVLVNTARCLADVRARVEQFGLLGGISSFGAAIWDGVFARESWLVGDRAARQMSELRSALRADPGIVMDSAHDCSVRVSTIVNGVPTPIVGSEARRLLDRLNLSDLGFWVAPRHTDFVDRTVDKGSGVQRLQQELGLVSLPLAALGDAGCDIPMLRMAHFAFLPAATLPSYSPVRGQRLMRCRSLGDQALWEAACHLVPEVALQRQVLSLVQSLDLPEWIPASLRRFPAAGKGLIPRIAAAIASINRTGLTKSSTEEDR